MERVNLIATSSLKYAGVRLKPGEAFTAPRAHARAFVAIKRAKHADVVATTPEPEPSGTYETASMEASPPVTPPSDSKRTYRTRQMRSKP